MKQYIGFVNDHSGSMSGLAKAACKDYNDNITAVKNAATTEMLDTVVSVVGVGYPRGSDVTRQVQISNPHVLKPITNWSVQGGTPLYDGIGDMIELLSDLPDANNEDVSFLVMVTTDGEEAHSTKYGQDRLKAFIEKVSQTGRWTFTFRVPRGARLSLINNLGVPLGNIQQWDTTAQGMAESTHVNAQAMNTYFSARSAGVKSTGAFYADASKVNTNALTDISKEVSLYVVPQHENGIEIRPFVLQHRMEYLKGAAFYQLTKTEARVSHTKLILVRDRNTGKIYAGKEARDMIGLPNDRNARLHPGDHKNYDLFIQSESVNRKLVAGTGLIYWEKVGVKFTEADLSYLKPKVDNGVVQLPAVAPTNKPTPSPIPAAKKVQTDVRFFTRKEARDYCKQVNKPQSEIRDFGMFNSPRWVV